MDLPRRVVGVGPDQLVYGGPVQVGWPDTKISLELVQAPVDVEARVPGVVALPDGHRCAPKTVAGNRPITSAFEPFAERPVAYVGRHPVNFLVQLQHRVLERAVTLTNQELTAW